MSGGGFKVGLPEVEDFVLLRGEVGHLAELREALDLGLEWLGLDERPHGALGVAAGEVRRGAGAQGLSRRETRRVETRGGSAAAW